MTNMFTLILLVILMLGFSYFATVNTQLSIITIPGYAQLEIPLYILIGITLVLGLSFSWIVNLLDSLSVAMKLRGKEHVIKDAKTTIQELTKKVNQLEIENAKLTGRLENHPDPESM